MLKCSKEALTGNESVRAPLGILFYLRLNQLSGKSSLSLDGLSCASVADDADYNRKKRY